MPLIILLIGTIIASVLYLANISLRSQGRSKVRIDVLTTLDMIEQDIKNSKSIDSATDGSTTNLVLTAFATDRNPLNPSRSLIRASDCSVATGGISPLEAATYQVRYQKQDDTLTREVIMGACAASSTVWQKNGTEVLIKNADPLAMTVTYPASSTANPSVALASLSVGRKIGGRTVEYTASMYAQSANIK